MGNVTVLDQFAHSHLEGSLSNCATVTNFVVM